MWCVSKWIYRAAFSSLINIFYTANFMKNWIKNNFPEWNGEVTKKSTLILKILNVELNFHILTYVCTERINEVFLNFSTSFWRTSFCGRRTWNVCAWNNILETVHCHLSVQSLKFINYKLYAVCKNKYILWVMYTSYKSYCITGSQSTKGTWNVQKKNGTWFQD